MDQYTLFPNSTTYPPSSLLECTVCACIIGNDYNKISRHLQWHQFIALIGERLAITMP